jgi:hypothetical protein
MVKILPRLTKDPGSATGSIETPNNDHRTHDGSIKYFPILFRFILRNSSFNSQSLGLMAFPVFCLYFSFRFKFVVWVFGSWRFPFRYKSIRKGLIIETMCLIILWGYLYVCFPFNWLYTCKIDSVMFDLILPLELIPFEAGNCSFRF